LGAAELISRLCAGGWRNIFTERGDLAHLALLLWAFSASALTWFALRELAATSRRFDDWRPLMDRFNFVMPLDKLKTDSRHNHVDIFREFLDHLGRIPHNRSDKVARGERPGPNL
jgi:hypothetical protein